MPIETTKTSSGSGEDDFMLRLFERYCLEELHNPDLHRLAVQQAESAEARHQDDLRY